MALNGDLQPGGTYVKRTGIVLTVVPGNPIFDIEIQRAPDSAGSPNVGSAISITQIPAPIPESGAVYVNYLPITGAIYYYRARSRASGYSDGDWTAWTVGASAVVLDLAPLQPYPAVYPVK